MKAQAALLTILSLTQITELKLLLDIGRSGHRFYDFVLTMLLACISFELLIGIIIIYIGNLHYYNQPSEQTLCCCYKPTQASESPAKTSREIPVSSKRRYCCCCPRHWYRRFPVKASSSYKTVRETPAVELSGPSSLPVTSPILSTIESKFVSSFDSKGVPVERSEANIEMARVKIADAEIKIIRSTNYVKIVEDAFSKSCNNADMQAELTRAKEELASATREKEEAEAEKKLGEAQKHHALFVEEQLEDRQEKVTFRKMAFWQHMATYLLYFVMLMNVFITTFGISGGNSSAAVALITTTTTTANFTK